MEGKKNFEEPVLKVMEFSVEDIVTDSSSVDPSADIGGDAVED